MHPHFARSRGLVAPLAFALALATPPLALAAAHPGRPARPTPLVDANIVAIVQADNDGEIANGSLLQGSAWDPDVKALARRMVANHTAANEHLKAVALRLGLRPVHDSISRGLVRSAEATHAHLAGLHGSALDLAYLDAEIARHKEMIALFDQKLIPAAQAVALRSLLVQLRPELTAHLDLAQAERARIRG